ncbi:uncharacterized mitochondrial protein AtMg00810-like [Nymphaea colorata]|uniref:uncharacterized mitochondrial protein AtMg00810-like n=1 Tax=Nymphaea colorata TaxID=210225 RepID=UPI00129D26CB|nr:uncharacterized mitochondrial protein AtMg00810-like [Nymphaea colorata]
MGCAFSIKDLGHLHYFLGVEAQFTPQGLFLSQRQYMQDLLKQSNMVDVKPLPSPLAVGEKLSKFDGTPLLDPTPYRQIVGALQYATLSRPDLAYATNKVCQFMQAPTTVHWAAVKHILRYIKHTLHLGFLIRPSSHLSLTAYSDTDWAGNPDDRRSTTGFAIFLGDSLVSWSAKKQNTVARSSTEAEYRALASTAAEVLSI